MNSLQSQTSLRRLSARLSQEIGIYFPESRLPELEKRLAGAVNRFGHNSVHELIGWLADADWKQNEYDQLAHLLTIGETYFFRDASLWTLLSATLLPQFARCRRASGVAIWSAACCTGEEPYTVSIVARRTFGRSRCREVKIVASDLNNEFLQHARSGRYGTWSLRATPADVREDFFTSLPDNQFQLSREIIDAVDFVQCNLVSEMSAPPIALRKFDIILCRNVLMYFSDEQSRAVVRTLHSRLADDGVLVVSPHDIWRISDDLFEKRFEGGVFLLEKKAAASHQSKVQSHLPVRLSVSPDEPEALSLSPQQLMATGNFARAAALLSQRLANGEQHSETLRAAIDCYSQLRSFEQAMHWNERAISLYPLSAQFYYLKALLLEETSGAQSSIGPLQQAVFLDSGFVMAHFALFNALRKSGQFDRAIISLNNLKRLLRRYQRTDIVAESDGLPAGHLLDIVNSMQVLTDD